mmetsp:Transcript_3584/g.12745  ORF Transcript_3584/g.12745 Transcript_3584/m.12745 type:complete len:220 (-) Transcript_3584:4655-5314(-)
MISLVTKFRYTAIPPWSRVLTKCTCSPGPLRQVLRCGQRKRRYTLLLVVKLILLPSPCTEVRLSSQQCITTRKESIRVVSWYSKLQCTRLHPPHPFHRLNFLDNTKCLRKMAPPDIRNSEYRLMSMVTRLSSVHTKKTTGVILGRMEVFTCTFEAISLGVCNRKLSQAMVQRMITLAFLSLFSATLSWLVLTRTTTTVLKVEAFTFLLDPERRGLNSRR